MPSDGSRRSPLTIAFAATAAVVVVGGLLLGFFGIGAEMAEPKTIRFTIRNRNIEPEIARQIKPGDPLYTDTAGTQVGRVVDVKVVPQPTAVADDEGTVHLGADPTAVQIDTTVEARGREGNGLIVLDTQVVQSGSFINLISKRYYLSGAVISVDVP